MEKIVKDWTKWIALTLNDNARIDGNLKDDNFCTTDRIVLKSIEELEKQSLKTRLRSATDFALMNFAGQPFYYRDKTETGKIPCSYWSRSSKSKLQDVHKDAVYIDSDGDVDNASLGTSIQGVCPSLSLMLPEKMSPEKMLREIGGVQKIRSQKGKLLYKTVEFGEYPKTKVSSELQKVLDELYNDGRLRDGLRCTGRLYTTNGALFEFNSYLDNDENFMSKQTPEFEYNGRKYVRSATMPFVRGEYEDGSDVGVLGDAQWVSVEPVRFRIENYEDFIKGKTKMLELESEEAVLANLPFYPFDTHVNSAMWQNSLLRAFLNSAKTSEMDGVKDYEAALKWNFKNSGFLYQAFNMTRGPIKEYVVSENEDAICDYAFDGCVALEKIAIPPHVTKIGNYAFAGCVNAQVCFRPGRKLIFAPNAFAESNFNFIYIAKDGESFILSPKEDQNLDREYLKREFNPKEIYKYVKYNYRKNLAQLNEWRQNGSIKFIPPEFTINLFPASEMKKYFVNNNHQRWGRLVKSLGFDGLEEPQKSNSLSDLMKIYYAIGGFSEKQGESEKAFDYVQKYVAKIDKYGEVPAKMGQLVHRRFSKIKLSGAYNPTFAEFFMKYYHQNPHFMSFKVADIEGLYNQDELIDKEEIKDYLCMAHNSFDRILRNFPYRVVNGNEERALLSPKFVAEHSMTVEYDGIDAGNELLAETIGRYGYCEEEFERIQDFFNMAKSIKNNFVICADKAKGENGISFRVLEKDDPLGFVLGEITNCCQHIGGAGEDCVYDGYTNPNAGFLVFEETQFDDEGKSTGVARILGQAYIWYDPQTKTVCYDNIEIPTKVLEELRRGTKHGAKLSSTTLLDSVEESADAIMNAMNRKGVRVDKVTTGQGYNNLNSELKQRYGSPERYPLAQNREYTGYSDARDAQYLIRTYDETTKMYADIIRETAKIIEADLEDIKSAKNQKSFE